MKKGKIILFLGIVVMTIGCGSQAQETAMTTEIVTEEQTTKEIQKENLEEENLQSKKEETFEEVAKLLGMQDSETKDMLGGGEENWTDDRSFYIGRIYDANLYGESCSVYTTCNADSIVESISIWIVSGDHTVTDEEAQKWETHISDYTGMQPTQESVSEESGNRQKKWIKDGRIVILNRMADILTISFQEMVGELQ